MSSSKKCNITNHGFVQMIKWRRKLKLEQTLGKLIKFVIIGPTEKKTTFIPSMLADITQNTGTGNATSSQPTMTDDLIQTKPRTRGQQIFKLT